MNLIRKRLGKLIKKTAEINDKDLQKLKFSKLSDDQLEELFEFMYREVGNNLDELGIDVEGGVILPSSQMEFDREYIDEWLDELKEEQNDDYGEEDDDDIGLGDDFDSPDLPDPSTWDYYVSYGGDLDSGFEEATRKEYIEQIRSKDFEEGIMEYMKDNFDKEKLQDLSNLIFK